MPTYASPYLLKGTVSETRTGGFPTSPPASTDIGPSNANRFRTSVNSDLDESQLYYWTRQWQDSEKQARADIQAGRVTKLNGTNEIEAHFNQLAEQPQRNNEKRDDIPK